jgi:ATP synthase protein I
VPPASATVPASRASLVILRAAVVPTVAVGLIAIVLYGSLRGTSAAVGAAVGLVVVLAFFGCGLYALGLILTKHPSLIMSAALALYLGQILVLFVFMAIFKDTTLFDGKAFGITVVACTVAWLVTQVWAMGRTRMLYVEPPAGSPTAPSGVDEAGDRQ